MQDTSVTRTSYWVKVRYRQTGREAVLTFDYDTTRVLAMFLLASRADVLAEGMGTR